MQERMSAYRQMQEDTQQETDRRVHFRDDDTVILSPSAPSKIVKDGHCLVDVEHQQ